MTFQNFQYQPFVAVSGNLGGKIPVVDDIYHLMNNTFILPRHRMKTAISLSFKLTAIITLV